MAKNVRGHTTTQKLQNRVLGPKESWHTDEAQVHFCWTLNCYLFKSEGFFVVDWFCWWWFVGFCFLGFFLVWVVGLFFSCEIFNEEVEAV